jgi:energy-coupling factor transporter ATP-binding protein EcfA2
MLDRVGLAGRAGHHPNEMSGGEQQRVTVARARVARPSIVWADEPTGNLDTAMAAQIMAVLQRLNAEDGQTIVLVTHDPSIGAGATRLIRMRDGRLVGDEPVRPVTVRGFQARTVRRAVMGESAFVAVEGVLIGTVLGVLTTWLLYQNSPAFGTLTAEFPIAWTQIGLTVGATLIASLLATIGPARRAAGIKPAVALRIAD